MRGRWLYSCCFVGCYLRDLFNIARSILGLLLSSFFFIDLVSVHVVHPCSSIDTTAAWKKLRFILSVRSDFHMTDSLFMAVHAFANRVSFSVGGTLLPRLVTLSISFRELPLSVVMSPLWIMHMYSVLSALTLRPMPPASRSRLCSRVSAWTGHIYIYIYIYIYCHPQTVSLYHNFSARLDTQDASGWDRNPPNFTLDMAFNCSAI